MKCQNCKKPIISRKDLVVSYWWSNQIPMLGLYHKNCFEDFKSKVPSLITPASVDPNRLKVFSFISYGEIFLFLVFPLIGLYLNRYKIDWSTFFQVSGKGYFIIVFGSIFILGVLFMAIWNLVMIKRIRKLQ